MNLKDIEKILKNYLDYIKTNSSPIKKTSNFVWGKNVIRLKDLGNGKYERDEHELENWYISLPCNEETYVPALVDCFKELVRQKDNPQSMTCETAKDYTCHQLCDWEWLENDNGEIVQNGKATLVKYAIILKDLGNNMKDGKKQQCVICHKDITNELPKIDIYGNHYCKDCYIEKCKYELMNMRDAILINKELLKRELQFLEEQTQKQTRKETAKEIYERLIELSENPCNDREEIYKEVFGRYGVEVEE